MDVIVKGKNFVLDEAIIAYAEQKFGRLDRYVPNLWRAEVEIAAESTREVQGRHIVDVNLVGKDLSLRGEERAAEPRVAIDTLVDTMKQRLQRLKSMQETARHRSPGAKGMAADAIPPIPDFGDGGER